MILAAGMMFFIGVPGSTSAAQPPDPTEQMRPFVDRIVAILTDPDLQGEEKCIKRREKVMEVASERFDFHEMSKRVLGRTWNTLDKDDQDYFVSLFKRLLEHAYIGKIEDYSEQKVVFRDQRVRGDRAQVDTDIVDQDLVIAVSYIMLLEGDMWKVYDIVVEGVSLVRNYMEQFKEILRKESYASLLKQVEDKVTELEQSIGKPCPVEIRDKADA
ncbi:MAG: ABC transporter substrate-binding protein [Desulfobulbaceae bacterium]|nr:ABC transporter substrate-binding protein [Desulfobulbaceae bacterium]